MTTISVSQFVDTVNNVLLAGLPAGAFEIEGEVASFGISGGQWVRFDLKDGESIVNCFMTTWQLKEQLTDGMKIAITGYAKVYPKFGKFSVNVQSVRLSGEGSLKKAYELLKKKLEAEGLFAQARKRELPRFPERVALITSRDAAAYTDFLRVSGARWPLCEIVLFHSQVQGADAVKTIVGAIGEANEDSGGFDAIVVTRGGGSMEDLHAFNTEEVARAVFASNIPVISAVGHERDVTIIDFVADVRAATPSNAAELLFPDSAEVLSEISYFIRRQSHSIDMRISADRTRVTKLMYAADRWINVLVDRVKRLDQSLRVALSVFAGRVTQKREMITQSTRLMQSLHPRELLKRGYSYTTDTEGAVITSAAGLKRVKNARQIYHDGAVDISVLSGLE